MAYFEIVFKNSAAKEFKKLDPPVVKRIADQIDKLQISPFPHGVEKLKTYESPVLYRIRIGDYRVLYCVDIDLKVITIFAVRHRREVYR